MTTLVAGPARLRTNHRFSPGTLGWVAGIHVLLLLLLAGIGLIWIKPPEPNFIEMVDLSPPGVPSGIPTEPAHAPQPAPAPPSPPSPVRDITPPPAPEPPTPAPAPEPEPVIPEPAPAPKPVPQPQPAPIPKPAPKPVLQPKPATPAPKPATPQVKVDLSNKVTRPTNSASSPVPSSSATSSSPTTSAIQNRLNQSLQSVGVTSNNPGSSSGANSYNGLIKAVIDAQWKQPPIQDKLETLVTIRVKPDGTIVPVTIRRSSGNDVMDESVMAAIRAAGKVPQPLPPGLGNPDYEVSIKFQLN